MIDKTREEIILPAMPSEEEAAKYLRLKSIHLAAIKMLAMKGDDRPQ